jgi:transketolase
MRSAFRLAFAALADADPRILLLLGDVGAGMFADYASKNPVRVLNLGTAEQTLIGCAAGLAHAGFRPVVYSFTPFLLERAFEQVKLDIAHDAAPVGLVGCSDPTQGPTHAALCPRTLLSVLPEIQGFFPRTPDEIVSHLRTRDPDRPWFLSL